MEKKTKVILNESHSLMEDQVRVLNETFEDNWEILPVPAEGWTLAEMREMENKFGGEDVVFASPVPVLLSEISWSSGALTTACALGANRSPSEVNVGEVFVLHNDNRDAREITLPDGKKKLVHTVAKTGWELV